MNDNKEIKKKSGLKDKLDTMNPVKSGSPLNPVGKELFLKTDDKSGLSDKEIVGALGILLSKAVTGRCRILIIPPDITRSNSGAGKITAAIYNMLKDKCSIDVMPALGTHMPMDGCELEEMFGKDIPGDRYIVHNWRTDVVKVGEVPAVYVSKASDGLVNESIDAEVNRKLLDNSYSLIISVGQVVPHEIAGMANYSKNIFVGCGGRNMISKSHMLGAFYGAEKIMGRADSPVRKVFDYAEKHFLSGIPLLYILTVTTQFNGKTAVNGIFAGRRRKVFEEAARLSIEKNLTYVDKPLKKVVVYLDEKEFKTTWLGNKAVYRTRMAIEKGGELVILAPGVRKFGEDDGNDGIIRKYGYCGREKVLELCGKREDLKSNLSAASHLIHGSSDGKFTITYAVKRISKQEIEKAGYIYMDYDKAVQRYDPEILKDGYNKLEDGEEIYYISNPALGLWTVKK